jgi:hypothetical protein
VTDRDNSGQKHDGGLPPAFFKTMLSLGMNPEIVACIQDAREVLAFNLPESERGSFLSFDNFIRDKIAHYEWVSAGTISLSRHGFILVGGGEALPVTKEHNTERLTKALALRVRMLKACIDEMLTVFVAEARAWEATRAP